MLTYLVMIFLFLHAGGQSNGEIYLKTLVQYGIQPYIEKWLDKGAHVEPSLVDKIGEKNLFCSLKTKRKIKDLLTNQH